MSSSPLMLIAIILGAILVAYLGKLLIEAQEERELLGQNLRRYESLSSREETEKQLDSNIQLKESEIQNLNLVKENLKTEITNLQSKLRELETKDYLISIDSYEPEYNFLSSGDYLKKLEDIKLKQQRMRQKKQAFICDSQWTVGEGKGAKNKGDNTKKQLLKLIEFAFEEQCKYAIKEVKYNNVENLRKKIDKSFHRINKLQQIGCRISNDYLNLKFRELYLKHEFKEKEQEEKERDKAIQEQMKQEKKERIAIEKAQQKAEEAENRKKQYEEQLERVRLEAQQASDLQIREYERQIQDLEEQISREIIVQEKANLDYKKLKSGYIYIISNIGSLGRDIYRIFMTKSGEPDAYIRTMNPYVPFPFDIHYKIRSEDASATIQCLHEQFNDKRVNIINERREFFKVSFNEIEQVIQKLDRETGTLRIEKDEKTPQAYEYRRTQAAERKKSSDTTLSNVHMNENVG